MTEKKIEEQTAEEALAEGFESDLPLGLPEAQSTLETEPKPGEEPAAEEPEYVQLTKKDFERLIASADETDKLKTQLPKVFGTMGNLQQVVTGLQKTTPAGEAVEMSEEDAAEMTAEFPELAGMLRTAVNRVLKRQKVKGTGEAEPAKPATESVDRETILKELRSDHVKRELEALNDLHPDWREVVGQKLVDGKAVLNDEGKAVIDLNSEFHKWLGTQPEDYQKKIMDTQSASITARAIDKFKAAKAAAKPFAKQTPAPREAARLDRIRENVQPKGGGGPAPGPATKSANDHLMEGFASG